MLCVGWVGRAHTLVCMWSSEENFGGLVLSFRPHMGTRVPWSLGLGDESYLVLAVCGYLLSFENKASQIKLKDFRSPMPLKNAFPSYRTVMECEHAFSPLKKNTESVKSYLVMVPIPKHSLSWHWLR